MDKSERGKNSGVRTKEWRLLNLPGHILCSAGNGACLRGNGLVGRIRQRALHAAVGELPSVA